MKKIISTVLAITLIFTIVPLSYSISLNDENTYEGISTYKALYNNINFQDIDEHWAKDSIYRMSSFSIIKGMGNSRFNPGDYLTREEAIALLVRLIGLEDEAQRLGEESINNLDTGGYTILTPGDYWARGYIEAAINNNIITDEEVDKITTLTDEEENNTEIEIEERIIDYEIDPNLTDEQLTNIEDQLRERVENRYTWKEPVDREQVAVWVARVLDLEPVYGQAQQKIYNLNDWEEINTLNLPIIEALLQQGIMQGDDNGYFRPKSSLTRAEMAKLLDNIYEDFLIERGYSIKSGIVERIDTIFQSEENTNLIKKIIRTNNDDNTLSYLVFQDASDDTKDKGFIVYKNGKLTFPDDIKEYDYIKYYINQNGEIVFAEVLNNRSFEIEGFIEEIDADKNTITIKNYDDQIFNFEIVPGANVRINNQGAKLKDLLYGQEVTIRVSNGKVTDIVGYLDTGEEGYIHPGERIHIGKVLYVDTEDNEITLMEDNQELDFTIEPFTSVYKDGVNVGIGGVKEGDIVRLEFDEYRGNRPTKVYISQPDRQIKNLYKATLSYFNPNRNELILKDIKYYDHTEWKDKGENMRLSLGYNTEIYADGMKVSNKNLSNHLGKEVYIATRDNYGKEEAMKVVMKNGYERKYYNTLQDIAFGDRRLKVDYNEVYFDYNSTIIVKDGKLVHPYNLREDDEIFVVSYGKDNYTAAFISIEDIQPTELTVYRGRIDEITQYGLEMDNYDILEGTEWDYSSKQIPFNISEDTEIIDTRGQEVNKVTVDEFTNSRFLKDDDKSNYYKEYAYAIAYDDMILALNIIDNDDEAQVLTTGIVKEIDRTNYTLTIEDVKDWSSFNNKWNINSSDININVSEALFIKNNKTVSINDIQENDSLYILRENSKGYVIVVR
ncbi:S-layer homology domain-containing protein [Thermohalobacter berrensis]|uniref:SLH domain-containing protein n=1 Tax=Thermohalobacter berrensis TaxID=99594 RepID=A0A419T7G4_9FIRM|nr:S-layer homology domain-containing protein [Thermohalobacter berrensis]RKD33500.1 hypothetical protein BET03_08930 [Thermohalobacter berrensis]